MLIGAIGDTGYNLMLLLHILAMIVAFAPSFVWPFVSVRLKKQGKPVGSTIFELAGGNSVKIHGPALAVGGILGFGLAGMSEAERRRWVRVIRDGVLAEQVTIG